MCADWKGELAGIWMQGLVIDTSNEIEFVAAALIGAAPNQMCSLCLVLSPHVHLPVTVNSVQNTSQLACQYDPHHTYLSRW
jgi:hypothetical protein